MGIKKINIENFTVFDNIEIEFSQGINVIIGENGIGKTHLLKIMYALINIEDDNVVATVSKYFQSDNQNDGYFENITKRNKDIVLRIESDLYNLKDKEDFNRNKYSYILNPIQEEKSLEISTDDNTRHRFRYSTKKESCIYIPAKDMLTHSEGFGSLYDERYVAFDKSYKDIVSKSLLANLKTIPKIGENILPKIEKIIGGKVVVENEIFYIVKDKQKIKFSTEAEGIKKIATLWKLIINGSITKNSVLFWDEPESNINPVLIKSIAEILIELSRNGVQIFVATHDYIFAKYIEVLMQDDDKVLFHSLYQNNDIVNCESNKNFRDLKQNLIISSFNALLDDVYDLNLGD